MKNECDLTLIDIINKLINDELEYGESFVSDYGSVFYVGWQDEYCKSNKVLRWTKTNEAVSLTSVTAKAKYKYETRFQQITYRQFFDGIKNNQENLYYSHYQSTIKPLDIDNLDSIFDLEEVKELKFYIKEY